MHHFRQKLSIKYWIYVIITAITVSKLGTWFFGLTKKYMQGKCETAVEKLWWRLYLANFAYTASEDLLAPKDGEPVNVYWVQDYHFPFWNAFYHRSALIHILFEVANGRTPCVKDKFGIWESLFKQPIVEKFSSNDVTDNTVKTVNFLPTFTAMNKFTNSIWRKLFRTYVRFNAKVLNYIEEELTNILSCPQKTLGVICRGTDYVKTKPKDHPKQPTVNEIIKRTKKWVKKYGYTKIYLATEEKNVLDCFEQEFPNMILTNKRTYYDEEMNEKKLDVITSVHFDRENDDYLKGLEYLSSMYILSKCDAIIGGNCGGTTIAMFFNDGKYSRTGIFDRGIY